MVRQALFSYHINDYFQRICLFIKNTLVLFMGLLGVTPIGVAIYNSYILMQTFLTRSLYHT